MCLHVRANSCVCQPQVAALLPRRLLVAAMTRAVLAVLMLFLLASGGKAFLCVCVRV